MNKLKRITFEKELEDPFYLKDPKLLELYKKCQPPKESYYYFPKGEEIIIHNYKKPIKSLRRVFYNVEYTNDEKQWLLDFKKFLNSHPELKIPNFIDDYFLLAFIYSSNNNLKESYKRLSDYIKFNNETFPIKITPKSKLIEILNRGFIYVYGRDNRYRPIIVCQCKVFQKCYKDYQNEELFQAFSCLFQFIINNMLIPSKYETWNMIVNMTGVSIVSLPEPLKKIIPELSDYYLCRLYKNYIIGLNFLTRILYKIVVNFLDKVTVAKINVLDKKKDPALFKDIRRDNIEEQFGGTAPNMPQENENGFFPPRMPSEHFIKEDENINDILITEDEYINKFKNGEIPEEIISPYIYQKLKLEEKKVQNNLSDKIEKNSEKISSEIKSFQNSNKIYKKSTIHTEEKSNTEKIKDLKNEQLLKIQSTLLKKQNILK